VTTLERLAFKPFRMCEKDSRILQDTLREVQRKAPSGSK
jgi:hypothetical protein